MNKGTFSFLSNQILGPDEEGLGTKLNSLWGQLAQRAPATKVLGMKLNSLWGQLNKRESVYKEPKTAGEGGGVSASLT